jgi:DNA-binding IclR family transcriptional regulator
MSERYRNDAQQRIFAGGADPVRPCVHGLPPSSIAKAVNCSAAVMTRDLANLSIAGLVEKDEATGHWRLTPRLPQQCFKIAAEIERADRRLRK